MARRSDDISKERKLLTMTQDEKRNAQRKRLMEEGKAQRKRAIKKEKYYGKQ